MPGYFHLEKGTQPDSVVIDDGVAPFELTRDELREHIAKLKEEWEHFTSAEYATLMSAYQRALAFLGPQS